MSRLKLFLRCFAEAIRTRGLRALASCVPFGDAAYEIAWETFQRLQSHADEDLVHAGLEEALACEESAVQEAAREVALEVAGDDPAAVQLALTQCLAQVPAQARRSVTAGGAGLPQLFLVSPRSVLALLPPGPARFRPGDALPGAGGLVLSELLGVGGFGEVWKAEDPRLKGIPPVAVKLCTSPDAAALLRHEATLLDRVLREGSAEGIVSLRRTSLETDPPWLEYEYVAGGDLGRLIREAGSLALAARLERAASVVGRLARILGATHRLDPPIVHRDLKPSNVLLRGQGDGLTLHVTDFGIGGIAAGRALAGVQAAGGRTGLLVTQLRGAHSPLYASDQQKEGAAPDPRDDVHALGVIWYQLLTGDVDRGIPADWTEELQEMGAPRGMIELLGQCVAGRAERRLADAALLADAIARLSRAGPRGTARPCEPDSTLSPRAAGEKAIAATREALADFGLEEFRSVQREAIEALLAGRRPLVLMPTGGGKSLCYQLPALVLARQAHALTVVISPLQALMEDQVLDLEEKGLDLATCINANLAPARRRRRLEWARQGRVGLLYLSPEQLRSQSVRAVLLERPPACWVIDEAHCISQWGHDFRPDYCYVPRFIRELAERQGHEPLLGLFTATATPAVQEDLRRLFARHALEPGPLVMADAARPNLDYRVIPAAANREQVLLHELREVLADPGCALVYTSSRKKAEELAARICQAGFACRHYHGGMSRARKREVLEAFRGGDLRVVAATCAFGMGINRPDVRAVIHHTMSTSLEAYLQETGRAGRDGLPARCTLLFDENDADQLFALRARGQLSEQDLRNVFLAVRALRNRAFGSASEDWFWASPGEIERASPAEEDVGPGADQRDTRLRVAIHLLEEFGMLQREENLSSRLRLELVSDDLAHSEKLIRQMPLSGDEQVRLLRLARAMHALRGRARAADGLLPTDLLCDAAGIGPGEVFGAVRELQLLGVCTFEVPLSFVLVRGGQTDARRVHDLTRDVEGRLLTLLEELTAEHGVQLNLRGVAGRLDPDRRLGLRAATVRELVEAWAEAGWTSLESVSRDVVRLGPLGPVRAALARHEQLTKAILDNLYEAVGARRGTQNVRASLEGLVEAAGSTVTPAADAAELEKVLGWLHDREVARLDEGLSLVRQAFKLRIVKGKQAGAVARPYREQVEPRYRDQYRRTHLMARYGKIAEPAARARYLEDYFRLDRDGFEARHGLSGEAERAALARPVLPQDEERILKGLSTAQREIVHAEDPALLVVAGPGSGKTRAIVHRIAALVRVRQVAPERILALAYNRNAIRELRLRLRDLVGPRAAGLRVFTFHGLALAVLGRTLGEVHRAGPDGPDQQGRRAGSEAFDDLLREACDLLEHGSSAGGLPDDSAARRARLLGSLEYIFVDEYQDVDETQYRFIRLLAGLGHAEEEDGPEATARRVQIRLCVIGDDDQNIYAFRGASSRFLLQYEEEYAARRLLLTENYRSREPIIEAANLLIAHNQERCKRLPHEQVRIDPGRAGQGGRPVAAVRLESRRAQAAWVCRQVRDWLDAGCAPGAIAILARHWDDLGPARLLLERAGVATHALDRGPVRLARSHATILLMEALRRDLHVVLGPQETVEGRVRRFFRARGRGPSEPTVAALIEIARDLDQERGGGGAGELLPITAEEVLESILEFDAAGDRHRDAGAVLVTSCHGAKGLEFDRVLLLTDGFADTKGEEREDERRLFYVAMTRARHELVLCGTRPCAFVAEAGAAWQTHSLPEANLPRRIIYRDLSPADVWLGSPQTQQEQTRIRALLEGDPLHLRGRTFQGRSGDAASGWAIHDTQGRCLGALSRGGTALLGRLGLDPQRQPLQPGEARVGRIYHHLGIDDTTGRVTQSWLVVIPQIRVCR